MWPNKTFYKCTLIISIITIFIISNIGANNKCANNSPPVVPKYHLMEKCQRSKLGIAAKAKYSSLISCLRLGIEKKALSLNFSPPEAQKMLKEPLEYTCEVLKCAEADGGLSLANDTRFDYYSIYAKPLPNKNSTCVPATGMFFLLSQRYNYTDGQQQCRNISGVLADVTSEQRTDALAQLLAGASVDAALVGLRRKNESIFYSVNVPNVRQSNVDILVEGKIDFVNDTTFLGITIDSKLQWGAHVSKGDSLECNTYRAWAPGHPRRYFNKFDCVVITRQRTWRSTSCNNTYPVLCELIPGGPYKRGSIFASRNVNVTDPAANRTENENA